MILETELREQMAGGCMFPVLDKASGKRKTLCGEKTLHAFDGGKFVFCAKHMKIVKQYVKEKRRQLKRGDRRPSGSMRIGNAGMDPK